MKISFLILLAAWPAAVIAGPRTSANYSILTDSVDTGGSRAVSANYSNVGGASLLAGVSTVAAPAEIAKVLRQARAV